MSKVYKFKSLGNDLFADVGECECLNPTFSFMRNAHEYKMPIKLSGYDDDYFFNTVNKEPREYECNKCGFKMLYQWKQDGVHVTKEDHKA